MAFQTSVKNRQAPGVEGGFASNNPIASAPSAEAGVVAISTGVLVGRFAWLTGRVAATTGTGAPNGFIGRDLLGMITSYLAETAMTILGGQPVPLYSRGEFWAINNGGVATVAGATVYANLTTGAIEVTSGAGNVATAFKFVSAVAAGELVKISTWS